MRILATAYAINPYKGSEDATGWQYALQIARYNDLIIYTRENNREFIEKYIQEEDSVPDYVSRISFKYYDTPYYTRFWKKGSRGALLYFYLWQIFIAFKLNKVEKNFDVVHNLNFHNNWTPTFLWILRKPLVWGPVAFHPKIPEPYTLFFSLKSKLKNKFTWIVKRVIWSCDPFLKLAKNNAKVVLAPNKEAFDLLGVPENKRKFLISVASEIPTRQIKKPKTNRFVVLTVGRFVELKGFDIALKSFKEFLNNLSDSEKKLARLIMVGKGPALPELRKYIKIHYLQNNVDIIEWMKREQLSDYYLDASCFLFCSHEGAGMVVPEAMSYGNPVICFNNIGPGIMIDETSGIGVNYTNYSKSIQDFANALNKLFYNEKLREKLSLGALERFRSTLTWNNKGEILKETYEEIC